MYINIFTRNKFQFWSTPPNHLIQWQSWSVSMDNFSVADDAEILYYIVKFDITLRNQVKQVNKKKIFRLFCNNCLILNYCIERQRKNP